MSSSTVVFPAPCTIPLPPDAQLEIVTKAIPDDPRVWVPQADRVFFRPLFFNTTNGQWCNLLKVCKAGFLSRHRHPAPVHGFVIKGQWRYLEHDWVATAGSYVFEPPGEIHTLVVDEDCEEMITFFNISGAMIYVVVEELIPESQAGRRTDLATSATMLGFAVMMWLDVALG